jgi:hypothetical protein
VVIALSGDVRGIHGKKARKHNPGDKITHWTKNANAVVIL